MSTYFEWAEAKAQRKAASEVGDFDLIDWPAVVVTEAECDEATEAEIRAAIRRARADA